MEVNSSRIPTRKELYDFLNEVLTCSMYNEKNMPRLKKDHLKYWQKLPDYPIVLLDFIGSARENIHKRRIASACLKTYLEDIFNDTLRNDAILEKGYGKILIYRLLMDILNFDDREMKEITASSVSLLLAMGFWNEVSLFLDNMIRSHDPGQIANWIMVMNKAMDSTFFLGLSVSDSVSEHLQPRWCEGLIDTLKMTNIPLEARSHCVQPMFMLLKLQHGPECLSRIIESFQTALSEPDEVNSDFALKRGIMKSLTTGYDFGHDHSDILIPALLPTVWNLLETCSDKCKIIVGKRDGTDEDADDFFDLVKWILEFIDQLISLPNDVLKDLERLMYNLYIFMSCHGNMERHLYAKAAQCCIHWSVRDVCGRILIKSLKELDLNQFEGKTKYLTTTYDVFQKISTELGSVRTSVNLNRECYVSRITESMAYGLGLIRSFCTVRDSELDSIQLGTYLNHYTDMLAGASPALQGRIIWLGGLYSQILTVQQMETHLELIQNILNCNDDSRYLVIPAMEALSRHFKCHTCQSLDKQDVLVKYGQKFFECLISVSNRLYRFELVSSLNAIGYLIKHQPNLVRANIERLDDLLITVLTKSSVHPDLMAQLNFTTKFLAKSQGFKSWLNDRFLGFLYKWLKHLEPDHLVHDLDVALQVLNTLCVYGENMPEDFVLRSFKAGVTRLMENVDRDHDVDYYASILLITLLVKLKTQFPNMLRMPKCHTIFTTFVHLIEKLTLPPVNFPQEVLGLLVVNACCSLSNRTEPLHEVIMRNLIANEETNIRTCLEIFIYFAMVKARWTLDLVAGLETPKGENVLRFLLRQWHPHLFREVSVIERKLFAQAMVRILVQCLDCKEERALLENIKIKGTNLSEQATFNGIEYLFYLLAHLLLIEVEMQENIALLANDSVDDLKNSQIKKRDDEAILYETHPFNLNIISHIVFFLNDSFEPYFTVLRKYMNEDQVAVLRRLGCCVPREFENISLETPD